MTRFRHRFGITTMLLLYVFCILRMILPWEFPQTHILESKVVYPAFYSLMRDPLPNSSGISLMLILALIWGIVSLCLLIRYLHNYRRAISGIRQYAEVWDRSAEDCLNAIKQDSKKLRIYGYTLPGITTPFSFGLFKKYILLPRRTFTEKDLYYSLLHEYTHCLNHDHAVKLLTDLFTIIFWWNPVVYLLKKDLEQTLELKCDQCVVEKLDAQQRAEYLRTIMHTMEQPAEPESLPYAGMPLYKPNTENLIKERFYAVLNGTQKKTRKIGNLVLPATFFLLLVLSYFILPQPSYGSPKLVNTENTIYFQLEDTYITKDSEGQFWVINPNTSPTSISEELAAMMMEDGFTLREE